MPHLFRLTEAASIALHGMILIASAEGEPVRTRSIADAFSVSEHHVSKVLQRLTKAGLLRTRRGPHGGFLLARLPAEITALMIYEAIEGELEPTQCLFGTPRCRQGDCVFGPLLHEFNALVVEHFSPVTLAEIVAMKRSRFLEALKPS